MRHRKQFTDITALMGQQEGAAVTAQSAHTIYVAASVPGQRTMGVRE